MNLVLMPALNATDGRQNDSSDPIIHAPFGALGLNGVYGLTSWVKSDSRYEGHQADLLLRKKFISELLNRAQHDFHGPSETHLFYAYYSKTSLVRSFHPLRDKAFEFYVILANNLAASNEDGRIQEWLSFIEENNSPSGQASPTIEKDYPCSGAVNFKVKDFDASLLDGLTEKLSLSFGKLSAVILSDTISALNENTRRLGIPSQGAEIRRFMDALGDARQRTVRIDKKIHANLIAKAHELSVSVSALSSFLFHLCLTRIRSSDSSTVSFL